jgi:hypothetical protein
MCRRSYALGLILAAAACARAASGPALPTDACAIGPGGAIAGAPDTLVIAVPGAIDPADAPVAASAAGRILFRQLYEPLIQVDCHGAVGPGLAAAWRPSEGGHVWVFTLRPGARFWDGVPVTARDVRDAWLGLGDRAGPAPWGDGAGAAVTVVDERTLTVRLATASATVPLAIADPRLAVVKRVAGLAAPLGTGPWWLDASAPAPTAVPVPPGRGPVLVFADRDDPRDALDAGADAVVTDDPATLAYAAERPDLAALPLPWDRTYVLAGAAPAVTIDRTSLAEDAVRLEARPAVLPDWFPDTAGCGPVGPAPEMPDQAGGGVIAYSPGDAAAAGLAARLAAVAGAGTRAVALGDADLAAHVERGGPAVLAVPRAALDPCVAWREFRARAPGVAAGAVRPLIDVRRRLILRRPLSGVFLDWDGVPRWR